MSLSTYRNGRSVNDKWLLAYLPQCVVHDSNGETVKTRNYLLKYKDKNRFRYSVFESVTPTSSDINLFDKSAMNVQI